MTAAQLMTPEEAHAEFKPDHVETCYMTPNDVSDLIQGLQKLLNPKSKVGVIYLNSLNPTTNNKMQMRIHISNKVME